MRELLEIFSIYARMSRIFFNLCANEVAQRVYLPLLLFQLMREPTSLWPKSAVDFEPFSVQGATRGLGSLLDEV